MMLIVVGVTRYTGEGMDIMEFTEAESNIHDLMWVLFKAIDLFQAHHCVPYGSAEYQQVKLSHHMFF